MALSFSISVPPSDTVAIERSMSISYEIENIGDYCILLAREIQCRRRAVAEIAVETRLPAGRRRPACGQLGRKVPEQDRWTRGPNRQAWRISPMNACAPISSAARCRRA